MPLCGFNKRRDGSLSGHRVTHSSQDTRALWTTNGAKGREPPRIRTRAGSFAFAPFAPVRAVRDPDVRAVRDPDGLGHAAHPHGRLGHALHWGRTRWSAPTAWASTGGLPTTAPLSLSPYFTAAPSQSAPRSRSCPRAQRRRRAPTGGATAGLLPSSPWYRSRRSPRSGDPSARGPGARAARRS